MHAVHLQFETLTGAALRPLLGELSALRIAVFREWPYLYDGTEAFERSYLGAYAEAPGSAIVVCRDGARIVGAATCGPMVEGHAGVRAVFVAAGLDPACICYFGESVLLPEWRGQGAGVRFFAAREAHARALGLAEATFCGVIRAPDDPRRPPGYVPLDGFWTRRGYRRRPELVVTLDWKPIDEPAPRPHPLVFWTRTL
jgi:GNAT superfamily N-acetyltransferase